MQLNRYHNVQFKCAFCHKEDIGSQMKYMGTNHSFFWIDMSTNKSNHVCYECLDKYFEQCDDCKKFINKDNIIFIKNSNKKICTHCALKRRNIFVCKHCKEYFEFHTLGNDFCPSCVNLLFKRCECCSQIKRKEELIFNKYCDDCFKNRIVKINAYNFKPEPVFFQCEEKNPLYLGIELELGGAKIENVNKFIHSIDEKHFYPKSDASIPSYGCEVVSHPCSRKYHIESGIWINLLLNACKWHLNGVLGTGIHVHMNRDYFTNKDIAFLDFFINRYENFWALVAKRRSSFACYRLKSLNQWGIQCDNRYCALNLSNRNTIELRIFKSSNDINEIIRIINICDGVANFVKTINRNICEKSNHDDTKDFIEYMKNNYNLNVL